MIESVFGGPYIPNTEDDRREMLAAIGVDQISDLFVDIPSAKRVSAIGLPESISELSLKLSLIHI